MSDEAGPRGRVASSTSTDVAVGLSLLASVAASIALIAVYTQGGHVQLEGALLAVALGGPGLGLALWSKRYMPQGPEVEDRPVLRSSPEEREAVLHELDQGERTVLRRRILTTLLTAAVGALGLAAIVPLRSLGPDVQPALRRTAWRSGKRVVDENGRPVRLADLELDSIVTAFPEGADEAERADGQVLLLRVDSSLLRPPPERADWSPSGVVAFSKICTHAGCPVGLYQVETHQLVCPCHQSLFDVTRSAEPIFGPAARPLPQLPLAVEDGFLVATGDFPEAVGPGFWSRGRS